MSFSLWTVNKFVSTNINAANSATGSYSQPVSLLVNGNTELQSNTTIKSLGVNKLASSSYALDVNGNVNIAGTTTFNTSLPTSTQTPTTSTQLITKAYADATYTGSGLLSANNTWTGTNTFTTLKVANRFGLQNATFITNNPATYQINWGDPDTLIIVPSSTVNSSGRIIITLPSIDITANKGAKFTIALGGLPIAGHKYPIDIYASSFGDLYFNQSTFSILGIDNGSGAYAQYPTAYEFVATNLTTNGWTVTATAWQTSMLNALLSSNNTWTGTNTFGTLNLSNKTGVQQTTFITTNPVSYNITWGSGQNILVMPSSTVNASNLINIYLPTITSDNIGGQFTIACGGIPSPPYNYPIYIKNSTSSPNIIYQNGEYSQLNLDNDSGSFIEWPTSYTLVATSVTNQTWTVVSSSYSDQAITQFYGELLAAANDWTNTNTFNTSLPTSTLTPTTSTQLITKAYADGKFGSLASANAWTSTNTFNSSLPTSTLTPTTSTQLITKAYGDATYATGAGIVASNNTWTGTNAFNTSLPTSTQTPTTSTQLITKTYADGKFGAIATTNIWTGTNSFNSSLPTSTLTPTTSTQLITKTYADGKFGAIASTNSWTGKNTFTAPAADYNIMKLSGVTDELLQVGYMNTPALGAYSTGVIVNLPQSTTGSYDNERFMVNYTDNTGTPQAALYVGSSALYQPFAINTLFQSIYFNWPIVIRSNIIVDNGYSISLGTSGYGDGFLYVAGGTSYIQILSAGGLRSNWITPSDTTSAATWYDTHASSLAFGNASATLTNNFATTTFTNPPIMSGENITAATIPGSALMVAYMDLITNQTVAGIKTFSSAPVMSGASITSGTVGQTQVSNGYCALSGNQTVAGIKTFSSAPVMSGASITSGTVGQTQVSNGYADLSSAQTIAGIKTFSSAPVMSGASITSGTVGQTQVSNGYCALSGNQTVAGIKTFSSAPVMSGASITSATIPDAALSANVPLENTANTFTGQNAINNQYVHQAYGTVITTTSTLTTLSAIIYEYYSVSAASTAYTITLPTITSANVGQKITFRRVGGTTTTAISFIGNGTQLIYNTAVTGQATANPLMASGVYIITLVGLLVTGTTYAYFQV